MSEILIKRNWTDKDMLKEIEDPGRKRGQTAGTFVDNLVSLAKTLILCPLCKHAFDWRKYGYYNIAHYEHIHCAGTCDGCRNSTAQGTLLIHETNVDACWMRKDEGRNFRNVRLGSRARR